MSFDPNGYIPRGLLTWVALITAIAPFLAGIPHNNQSHSKETGANSQLLPRLERNSYLQSELARSDPSSPTTTSTKLYAGHAKFHNGQTMSMGICLGVGTLWKTFWANDDQLLTASIFASMYYVTQASVSHIYI